MENSADLSSSVPISKPGRVVQSVACLSEESEIQSSIPRLANIFVDIDLEALINIYYNIIL